MVDDHHWGRAGDMAHLGTLASQFGYPEGELGSLECAVTHKSYSNEASEPIVHNERLEFLGDAVIDLVIAEALMNAHPQAPEGILSGKRAAIVNARSLAEGAQTLELGRVLRLGRGEQRSGGRRKESLLADAFEAVVGAIYSDLGLEAARAMLSSHFGERLKQVELRPAHRDFKTKLQEFCQKKLNRTPTYVVVEEKGPDHDKTFVVEVIVSESVRAHGRGRSKKSAQRDAARIALTILTASTEGEEAHSNGAYEGSPD